MIEDVYEPLARYRDVFRDAFSKLTRQTFKTLVAKSGIDIMANRRLSARARALEKDFNGASRHLGVVRFFRNAFYVFMAGCLLVVVLVCSGSNGAVSQGEQPILALALIGALAFLVFAIVLTVAASRAGATVTDLSQRLAAQRDNARQTLMPLYDLYSWDIPARLIQQVVPRLAFDPFFSAQRLADLQRLYDWNDEFDDTCSVFFAQSGVINGNPFVFGEYLKMEWGEKTYTGTREIHWTERVRDSEGHSHTIHHHQTLTATVTKPLPEHAKRKFLVYGNDAAPNLCFSRGPSDLSDGETGFFASLRRRHRLNELKAFSRNLTDDSNYTLMTNHEFELLFDTRNRTNEVEFRLLYTALAQRQTLELIKDKQVGYGDDFAFVKRHKINYIFAHHLDQMTLDTDPAALCDEWDYDKAAACFQNFNCAYFRHVYFALAPLLAIPLYQQTRTHEDIWKAVLPGEQASSWEYEAAANYMGAKPFRHRDCITPSILKAEVRGREAGVSRIAITAHGFRGVERTDYESVLGGDGHYHKVPVKWIEYLPVARTREFVASEGSSPSADFTRDYKAAARRIFRRGIYAFVS